MTPEDKKLSQLLLDESYITEEDAQNAENHLEKNPSTTLVDYLIQSNLLNKKLLGQAIAEYYQIPFADLESKAPSKNDILKIPEEVAKQHHAIFFGEENNQITIATDNPENNSLKNELAPLFPGKEIQFAFGLTEAIEDNFIHYQKPLATRFSKIIEEQTQIAPEILDEIFNDALVFNASDIHFEPQINDVVLRFRVDGVLREAGRIPLENYENILNRVKIQSQLRIDEHYTAQDGSIHHETEKAAVDFRTSIVPTVNGEKIVLRVLASYVKSITMSDLGLASRDRMALEEASEKPFGMILVTGPTGSGKTTTLYAALRNLNNPKVNITTIEDPVEYKMVGINQIQVNSEADLTFSKGLRSIVRQDPDIILVGEIRDQETAEIAVNAALTGHLLLSTFHANDAATAIPRLLDMGIQPFLLASTLEVIVAQRLVRKICGRCRHSVTVTQADLPRTFTDLKRFFGKDEINLYLGKGCETCNQSGYHGRTAVYEFIKGSPEMKDLILKNPSSQEIWQLARAQGSRSLFEDGVEKVKNGLTTIEELLRVAEPPAK